MLNFEYFFTFNIYYTSHCLNSVIPSLKMLISVASFADNKADRRALESEGFPYAVFKVSLIRKMEQLGIVAKDNKCRRLGRGLGYVVYLKALALIGRWLYARGGLGQKVV